MADGDDIERFEEERELELYREYREAQQNLGCDRPLVALDQIQIGGGNTQGFGHGRLGQAALPPEAVRQAKKLIRHGQKDIGGRIAEELELFGQRLVSPEAAAAADAASEAPLCAACSPDF